jgi:imidazolonepropionase
MEADLVIRNAREVVTTTGASSAPLSGQQMRGVTVIPNGFVAAHNGKIIAVGAEAELKGKIQLSAGARVIDAEQRVVIPGLVDPHTHLLFAGAREDEFLMRVAGESYMAIARAGGGIGRTVTETRKAGAQELMARGLKNLAMVMRQGTTTIEIKSGYGLSTATELEMLRVTRDLERQSPATIVSTFLGAHALAPEYKGRPDDFVEMVATEMLPAVKQENLAEYCDIFCEKGAFTVDQSRVVLKAAADLDFGIKIHGNELSASGGCALAAEMKAVSVDHCNFATPDELASMRAAGTIAVTLPGTPFFLLAPRYADGRMIIDTNVPLALATDYNPTSSISSMPFVMFLACRYMHLDPVEALCGATINAAHAVGLADRVGSLEPGKSADALILDVEDFRHIPFYVGRDIVDLVVKSGTPVCGKRVEAQRH